MAPNHDPQNPNPFSSIIFFLLLLLSSSSSSSSPSMAASDSLIAFLVRLQSEALTTLGPKNFDPKLYVDLPLKTDLSAAESAFARLPRSAEGGAIPAPDLERFIDDHFDEAGSDLLFVEPADFAAEPEGFLPNVENPRVRAWALEVHSLWKNLSRRVADEVRERPERHTLLPLPSPVIVPGSRFREVYYWDSYWIVRGLLVSKMYDTAKGIVNSLISLIEKYGHVLNGARTYYSNRRDFPNGWAPLQHLIVEGLAYSGSIEAKSVAEDIAIRWIRTNYAAYKKTGAMHEKYDVTKCGTPGGGGEYKPQTGFGWSNGVVLAFLEAFGWPRDREIEC